MAGIYIHIPFCKQACSYCNFHFSTRLSRKGEMLNALLQELEQRKFYLQNESISSIYFGGGTPSLLTVSELNHLLAAIYKHFIIEENAEITLEANPDDIDKEKLAKLKNTPINRLSIGVQSFFDEDLRFMNRAHSSKEALQSIKLAQDSGFPQLNIDLIFGSQSTSDMMWEKNLNQFFSLEVPHLSAYSLTIEEKTAIAHQIKTGQTKPLDESRNYRQYQMLQDQLPRHGFEQYELSNYCNNTGYAKHNTGYWFGKNYLGIGPSAHSYNGKSRQWNINNNKQYLNALHEGKPYYEIEVLSERDHYHEFLITSLRTKWGIQLKNIKQFSPSIQQHFYKKIKSLPIDKLQESDNCLSLKSSFLFQSDEVVRHFMISS